MALNCAFFAWKERDTYTLRWVFEGCWPQSPEAFEWEACYLKQDYGTDASIDEY
jgi:hypothetical protein